MRKTKRRLPVRNITLFLIWLSFSFLSFINSWRHY